MPAPGTLPGGTRAFPGGVADLDGRRGFTVTSDGTLHLVDIDRGRVIAHRAGVRRAIGLIDDQLAILATADGDRGADLRSLLVDATTLEPIGPPVAVPIPPWVDTSDPGATLAVDAQLTGTVLHLTWQADTGYSGGAPPPPSVERASRRSTTGEAAIDLATGAIAQPAPAGTVAEQPTAPGDHESQTYAVNGEWHRTSWPAGGVVACIAGEELDPTADVLLRRWDRSTGDELDPVVVARGSRQQLAVTADGAYLLTRAAVAPGDDPSPWHLIDVGGGTPAATLTNVPPDAHSPAVLDGTLYFLVDRPTSTPAHDVTRSRRPQPTVSDEPTGPQPGDPSAGPVVFLHARSLQDGTDRWPPLALTPV